MNAGPGDIAQWLQQACGFQRAGKWDEAADLFRGILAADPRSADALHSFGVMHAQRGEHETAIALIGQAIAAGLPELAVRSLEDYEALAERLAAGPAMLSALKRRLAGSRDTMALFDTPRYARSLEEAYRRCGVARSEARRPRVLRLVNHDEPTAQTAPKRVLLAL